MKTDNMQNEIKKLNKLLKVADTKLALRENEAEKTEEINTQVRFIEDCLY